MGADHAMELYIEELNKVAPRWAMTIPDLPVDDVEKPLPDQLDDEGLPVDYLLVAGVGAVALVGFYYWRKYRRAKTVAAGSMTLLSKL